MKSKSKELSIINGLDIFTKLELYLTYCNRVIFTDYNFYINILDSSINITYPKKGKILSYDEFFSEDNIKVYNHGDNWKTNGFAQQYDIRYAGAYWEYFHY